MRLSTAILFLSMSFLPAELLAQSTDVPPDLLQERRREQGDTITVCQDAGSPILEFNQDVAQAIGDALFVQVEFEQGFGGFPISGGGFLQELQIAMTNTCDVMMGMAVQEQSPFPDWVMMTRPYASFEYVLAVTDPDWQSLGDVPLDRMIGTQLSSLGEMVFITWNQQQPEDRRRKRLPYADQNLMVKRVADGTLGGMLVWQPVLQQLAADNADAAKLRLIDPAPMPRTVTRVGALVSSKDTFLRNQIDQAIDALVADGTIESIMQEYGYEGAAGDVQ